MSVFILGTFFLEVNYKLPCQVSMESLGNQRSSVVEQCETGAILRDASESKHVVQRRSDAKFKETFQSQYSTCKCYYACITTRFST